MPMVVSMLAVYAAAQDRANPLAGLVIGERPEPQLRRGWEVVTLRSSGLNHHDVWSLMGVGLAPDRLPMILGCDGAGVTDDGREVIVHAVVASDTWQGDETLDPGRTLLSELHPDVTLDPATRCPPRHTLWINPGRHSLSPSPQRSRGRVAEPATGIQRGLEVLEALGADDLGGAHDRGDPPRLGIPRKRGLQRPGQVVDQLAGVVEPAAHGARRQMEYRREHRRDEVVSSPEALRQPAALDLVALGDLPLEFLAPCKGLDENLLHRRDLVDRPLEGVDRGLGDLLLGHDQLARVDLDQRVGDLGRPGVTQRATGQRL